MNKEFDFIQFWAEEFKRNPIKNRKILDKFVTNQILLAQYQLKKLPPEKLIQIFNIKNETIIQHLQEHYNKSRNG
jgi:hypothetical protein